MVFAKEESDQLREIQRLWGDRDRLNMQYYDQDFDARELFDLLYAAARESKETLEEQQKMIPQGSIGYKCNHLTGGYGERPRCNSGLCCGTAELYPGAMGPDVRMEVCGQPEDTSSLWDKVDRIMGYPQFRDFEQPDGEQGLMSYYFACIEGSKSLAASSLAILTDAYIIA